MIISRTRTNLKFPYPPSDSGRTDARSEIPDGASERSAPGPKKACLRKVSALLTGSADPAPKMGTPHVLQGTLISDTLNANASSADFSYRNIKLDLSLECST